MDRKQPAKETQFRPAADSFMEAVNRRDPNSFKKIYLNYSEPLTRFSMRYVKNRSEAEDVVQDVMVELWAGKSRFSNEVQLRAYLYKAIKHRTLTALKRKKRLVFSLTGIEDRSYDNQSRNFFDVHYEIFSVFDASLGQLPKECKKIFSMLLKGISSAEIALREKCAASTVRAQKRRGISLLKACFLKSDATKDIINC
ncbi:MAG: RNA polymerase sigma factor [Bacteroidales bacterium]|jgi:RNA polymerase sigma-70 factor (ECF subfamily)